MKRTIKSTLGVAVGAALGFSYYYFVGCRTGGGCPISSNPYISIVYGGTIGLLLSWGKDTSKKSTS